MELLFEFRPEIVRVAGNLKPVQAEAEVLAEPVFRAERESGEFVVQCYGTVLRDRGCYRMWYSSFRKQAKAFDGTEQVFCGYAESDDCVTWRRPRVGLVEYAGNKDNNLCDMAMAGVSVFIDPDAPAGRRYCAAGYTQADYPGTRLPAGATSGYYTMHSADGLHWEFDRAAPTWPGNGDEVTHVYHPVQRRGIVMLKHEWIRGGLKRRGFWEADYRDGQYSAERSALVPDEFDDVAARARGFISGDYYHMGFMPAGKSTVGFVSHFRHDPPYHPAPLGWFGSVDLGLVYQLKEGDKWQHVWGRPDFLAHGRYPWMGQCIYASSCVVDLGEYQALPFTGVAKIHGYGFTCNSGTINRSERLQECEQNDWTAIGLARWRKNRLLGYRSDAGGTLDLTLGEQWGRVEVVLNCETAATGRVQAELIGEDRKVATAAVVVGDHAEAVLRWGEGTALPEVKGAAVLRLHVEVGTVWGYEVRRVG